MAAPTLHSPPLIKIPYYEIRAVNTSFNTIQFAVKGNVVLRRGDSSRIQSLRLDSLTPDESQSDLSQIEVYFQGGWQKACSGIEKNDVVEVVNCGVGLSRDSEVHPFKLLISESARQEEIRIRAFRKHRQYGSRITSHPYYPDYERVLDVDMSNLDQGVIMQHHNPSVISCHALNGSSVIPSGQRKSRRRSTGERRPYQYESIGSLWNEFVLGDERPEVKKKVNLYGIVVNARAVSTCRGPDLRSEVVLIDLDSVKITANGEPVCLRLFKFHKDPSDSLPYRAVGDIFRAHRVDIRKFIDPVTRRPGLQAQSQQWSTFVLWGLDSESFDPLKTQTNGRRHSYGITHHTITEEDKDTVKELRTWSRDFLRRTRMFPGMTARSGLESRTAPPASSIIRTVHDIVNPQFRPSCGQESFDLVGVFERPSHEDSNGIKFTLACPDARDFKPKVLVESEPTQGDIRDFRSVVESWAIRPVAERSWLCIRDPCIVKQNSVVRVILRFSKQTSTLLWLPKWAPYVRYSLRKYHASRRENGGSGVTTREPLRTRGTSTRERGPSLGCVATPRVRVVTIHANRDKPVTPVSRIYCLAGVYNSPTAFRIRGRMRGIIEPIDVRLVCRPWCNDCGVYLTGAVDSERESANDDKSSGISKQLSCDGCGKKLSGVEDPACNWAYLLRFVIEGMENHILSQAECIIEGKEGDLFFRGTPPANLFSNKQSRKAIRQYLNVLQRPESEIDCCVAPYSYCSTHLGLRKLMLKVFGTQMIPGIGD